MSLAKDYIRINQQSWNNRTERHIKSAFYDLPGFIAGNTSLNGIEMNMLGDISNKSILHLQCHFGQDSISLARMGANVTGVDFSNKAIEVANDLTIKTGTDTNTRFICCDIYELPNHLDEQFDIIFTSYGTIGWLPDMSKWAGIISQFLKPLGKLIFVEFHPFLWMFDEQFEKIVYNYFNTEAIIETLNGSYTDQAADLIQDYISWNHSISEVVNSLINHGIEILECNEFDYSPYNCFKNMTEHEPKKWVIEHLGNKIPMVYSISAIKKHTPSLADK